MYSPKKMLIDARNDASFLFVEERAQALCGFSTDSTRDIFSLFDK